MIFKLDDNFVRLTSTGKSNIEIQYFGEEEATALETLINLLKIGTPKKLNKFVIECGMAFNTELTIDLFHNVLDESNPLNLIWLSDFGKINLNRFLNIMPTSLNVKIPVKETFCNRLFIDNINSQNCPAILNNLTKLGVDLNRQFMDGSTVLHHAAASNTIEKKDHQFILRTLLDGGANPNIEDNKGQSALRCIEREEVANYLVQQSECKPRFTNKYNSISINKSAFKYPHIYQYCIQHGGIGVAISSIEREILSSETNFAINATKANKPVSLRI